MFTIIKTNNTFQNILPSITSCVVLPETGSSWLPKCCVVQSNVKNENVILSIGDITNVLRVVVEGKKMTMLFLTEYSSDFLLLLGQQIYIFSFKVYPLDKSRLQSLNKRVGRVQSCCGHDGSRKMPKLCQKFKLNCPVQNTRF